MVRSQNKVEMWYIIRIRYHKIELPEIMIFQHLCLELHISRRENGKREMATGKFPDGKWPFSREISRFWPKLA